MRCEVEESDNNSRTTPNLPKLTPIFQKSSASCHSHESSSPRRSPVVGSANSHGSHAHTSGHRPPSLMERVIPTASNSSTGAPTQSVHPPAHFHLPTSSPSNQQPIPPVQEIEQRPLSLPSNLTAPNLTTYIHHVHHYTFNGNCTIYQSTDQANSGMPSIHAEPGSYSYSHSERRWDPPPRESSMGVPAQPVQPPREYPAAMQAYGPLEPLGGLSIPAQSQEAGSSFLSPSRPEPASPFQPPYRLPRVEQIVPPPGLSDRRYQRQLSLTQLEPPAKRRARPVSVPHGIGSVGRASLPELSPLQANPPRFSSQQPPAAGSSSHDVHTANSSTPSEEDCGVTQRIGGSTADAGSQEQYQTSSTHAYSGAVEHENMNDWEHVVAMYLTGQGTSDGRPLRSLTKNDGSRVEDRKLLEKRRTIGKTYEKLGKALFEHAIGYKIDENTGLRKKQKMYHVIARCRVVNAIRKEGGQLPADPDDLERLITQRIAQKTEMRLLQSEGDARSSPAQGSSFVEPSHRLPHSSQPPAQLRAPGRSYLGQNPQFK